MNYEKLCVEQEALKNMKISLEVLGISPRAFQVDVDHKYGTSDPCPLYP